MSYLGNPTVANITALTRMSLNDGQFAYVLTVQDPWEFVANGAAFTVDNITVEATALGGATRWVRKLTYNAIWRLGRDNWYIDPVAGNDENTGLTPATALKTCLELWRRWGSQNLVKQSGASPNFAVNIHLLGDIVSPDSLILDCVLDDLTEIAVVATPTTIIASPAGATAMTPQSTATNTPWSLTDAVTAGTITVGARLRWTAGAAAGGTAWAAKNLGGNSWRFSQPQKSNIPTFSAFPTPVNPAANDAYVVERLTHVAIGYFNITQQNVADNFFTLVSLSDIQITAGIGGQQINWASNDIVDTIYVFDQCQFANSIIVRGLYFSNCGFLSGSDFRDLIWLTGGLMTGAQLYAWQGGGNGTLSGSPLIQGTFGLVAGNSSIIGDVGIFDTVAGVGGIGAGLVVGPFGAGGGTTAQGAVLINGTAGSIWGAGNAGVGIHVRSGNRAVIGQSALSIPTITGALGDFRLGETGQERSFVDATGVYSPVIAPTWANYVNPAQFAHNAHNVGQACHLVVLLP